MNSTKNVDIFRIGPKVSFIVIAYNALNTIRCCIESILAQDIDKEIILVDNNSTDGTIEQVQDLDVKIVFEAKRCRGAARNRGLEVASCEFVAFVDADVELSEGWTRRALELLDKHPEVAAVGGPGISSEKSWISSSINVLQYGRITSGDDRYVTSLPTMDIVYRRSIIQDMRFEEFWTAEDAEFNFRIIEKGYKLLWSRDLAVRHHHPITLSQLIKKSFKFGVWYPMPYRKHPNRITLGVLARVLHMPVLLLLLVLSAFWPLLWLAFMFWCFIPLFAYTIVGIRIRLFNNCDRLAAFVITHSFKQYAQMLGIWVGFLYGARK